MSNKVIFEFADEETANEFFQYYFHDGEKDLYTRQQFDDPKDPTKLTKITFRYDKKNKIIRGVNV